MQLTAFFRSSRVMALRFPQSLRSVQQFQRGIRLSSQNINSPAAGKSVRSMRLFSTTAVDNIISAIASKGDEIRELKAKKAGKDLIVPKVAELLQLKTEFQALTGNPFDPPKETPVVAASAGDTSSKEKKEEKKGKKDDTQNQNNQAKGIESSVITPRTTDYSAW